MSTYKDKIALRWSNLATKNGVFEKMYSLIDITIITAVPLTLLLLNQGWIFAKYSNLDEWMYVGYGYRYLDPTFYVDNYKISRLPWILVEALIRGFFPPIFSSWILGFGILALSNIALYFSLKTVFGRVAALFACVFMAGFTFMHANGGADYHNTLAGAFYCLAMLLCTRFARQEFAARDPVFFGAAIALTIHTNPVFINLVPILIGQYLLSYRIYHLAFPPLIRAARLTAFGALGVTVLLGLVNFSFGRQFLFFLPQFKLVSSFIADSSKQKPWWLPWSTGWFLNLPYMGIFAAGVLLSIVTIFIAAPLRSKSERYINVIIFASAYILSFLLWVFWQSLGQTAFQPSYYAYPLGFPLAGALAAAIATTTKRDVPPVLLTISAFGFAAATVVGVHDANLTVDFAQGISRFLAVRAFIGFAVAFMLLLIARRSLWFAPAAAITLCGANAMAVFDFPAYAMTNCQMDRDAYELILDASSELRKTLVPGTMVFVFSESGEEVKIGDGCKGTQAPLGWIQGAISATGFENVAFFWLNKTIETVEPERWREIVATKGIVAFLTYDPARISILRKEIEAAGGAPGEVGPLMLHEGSIELPLYIMSVHR